MKNFKLGDLAVYPNYGVGKVVSIEKRALGENEISCYVVSMVSSGSKVFVPILSIRTVFCRSFLFAEHRCRVLWYNKRLPN
ncbi:MAG TPA: CarD family transcriptional regulator [bacterium]|nr:CarD family transcriptional regulator [bacterium]